MTHDVEMPACPCPWCMYELTGAFTHGPAGTVPQPGDCAVCLNCAQLVAYTEHLTLRPLTVGEFEALPEAYRIALREAQGLVVIGINLDTAGSLGASEQFAVWSFFPTGDCQREASGLQARTAVELAERTRRSIGAQIGSTCRIVILAEGDNERTVWEWRHGEGLVFPKPASEVSGS